MSDLWYRFQTHCLNEGLSKKRISKLLFMYNVLENYWRGRDWAKLERRDFESFVDDLSRNVTKNRFNKNYSGSTKKDLKIFLKRFWKWYQGNNEYYPSSVAWVKSRISKDELPKVKDTMTRDEVLKLAYSFRNSEYQLATLLLFDSGFRIDEFLSCTMNNLTYELLNGKEYCYWLECQRSKTYPRKVDCQLFTEQIKNILQSPVYQNKDPQTNLVLFQYGAYRKALGINGKRLLNKKITPHCFRHSCATYYAGIYQGDRILLANRLAWTYSSKMLDLYIRRSTGFTFRAAAIVQETEIGSLKQDFQDMQRKMNLQEDKIKKMELALHETAKADILRKVYGKVNKH